MVVEEWKKSGIATKFPTYRNSKLITSQGWLAGKCEDDEAEGLWRINDGIYDFTDFIHKHPGGSFWLQETKGTDITEVFEVHHFSSVPAKMIEKYKVADAAKPRIYTLTLNENGFYKTLKRRVVDKLKNLDYGPKQKSDIIHLALLISMFVFAVASVKFNSWLYTILAGTTLCWTVISAHNYFHRRDNWRMYTFNLSMMNFCAWRISHAMSHHIYPNSYLDLELSMFEPFLCWVPNLHIKSLMMRYVSWVTEPLVYAIAMYLQIGTRIVYSLLHTNIMYWHDIISLSIPLSMYLSSDWNLLMCIRQWLLITAIASAAFCIIGLNAAHHDPRIHHEGDANREDRDWGLFQVDTIIDRGDLKKSQFLVLTHFGDHALHHLFPTLDHGILPQLYPVLYQTLDEFKGELRECNHLEHILGQHRQLLRIQPNLLPPGSQKL
ncbi:cytochrome b5-related protein isoform X1 [Stomoxys calcitrans]|uniref:Cytochrome b5-related protein n=1 Tax=Stomoxys calcitrans TaxID=35570 RepID=A0A1I8PVZ0_STOCA|nr:cytochrome b5-related protein isoform X1 [Stomoxys calcitrans]